MTENPEPRHPDDDPVAEALGDALRDAPDDLVIPPPVADIAERAAVKARARNARRTVGSVAASVMLVAGGVVAWNVASDGEPTEDVAVASADDDGSPEEASAEAEAPAPATSELADEPARPALDVDPAEYSTGPLLDWAEVAGPTGRGGSLSTLPDGRVLVRVWGEGDGAEEVFVTSDGETWDPVATPPGVSANVVDLGEELWVVTGWNLADVDFGDGVHVSADQGATWQELAVPGLGEARDSYLVTRSFIGAAAGFEGQIVVAVSSFTDVDVAQIAIDQGIATSREEVMGWGFGQDGDGNSTLTVDVSRRFGTGSGEIEPVVETFEFATAALGLPTDPDELFSPDSDTFTLLAGDADGLEPVGEFHGSPSRLVSVDGALVLSGFGETGPATWTSSDATTWTPVDVGDGFELAGVFEGEIWGGGWSPNGFVVQRLADGTVEDVATFPGLSPNSLISVGSSGLGATVATEASFLDSEGIPVDGEELVTEALDVLPTGVMAATDGIELRIEDDGTGVLIDTLAGEILREFSEEEMLGDEPPAGVIEIDDGTTFALRIEDPVTGQELVTFSTEDYPPGFEPAPTEPNTSSGFTVEGGSEGFAEYTEPAEVNIPENWVAWSANGTDWSFQRTTEAFGLGDQEDAWAQVAVGDGYVVAVIETFNNAVVEEALPGSAQPDIRWFLAQVD